MSRRHVFAVASLGLLLATGSAAARDRFYDFGQIWGDAVNEHKPGDAVSASPSDVMRQRPKHVFDSQTQPHDPSGRIILEGAR